MSRKKQKPTEKQLEQRKKIAFKRKIRNIFTGSGFAYVSTNDHHMQIGLRMVEVDSLFIYENVIILCEDTCTEAKDWKDHVRTKNEAFGEIKKNLSSFINKLSDLLPDRKDVLNKYSVDRLQVFCLYIAQKELSLTTEEYSLYSNMKFVNPQTLNYFQWMTQCIKLSARFELFRYLGLKSNQIGLMSSSSTRTSITAPIIYPKDITGITNRVRVVSFMMSAEDLINTCYVLRKDNWEESMWLYQRLIDKKKIKGIRSFLESKGEAFYNNIIVALPDDVKFLDATKNYKNIDEIGFFENDCQLEFAKEMNSICVIDGQHRIFAHYEGEANDRQEKKIASLRKQLHLLVTGLIFPADMSKIESARIQSEIFLEINSNAKPVPPNVLLHIQEIKDPLSDVGLAQRVIERLNKKQLFFNMFELSSLDDSKIKTASIVKFALRYLVTVNPAEGKISLINYWPGDKDALLKMDDQAFEMYIEFCAEKLRTYFSAIKNNIKSYWEDKGSKMLSVTSLNGFIIAFNRQLTTNGIRDFDFYNEQFKKWTFDFSKENFPFTSSQYRKFSTVILKEVFGIEDTAI
jgi:DGQHR domain-containing protein